MFDAAVVSSLNVNFLHILSSCLVMSLSVLCQTIKLPTSMILMLLISTMMKDVIRFIVKLRVAYIYN
mgnify:CR=1 FL=1